MAEQPYGMTGIKLKFEGRDYELLRGKRENGSAALLLINSKTGAALPATVMGGLLPHGPNDAHVIDEAGFLQVLESAGIVMATPTTGTIDGMKVRTCAVVHPDLVRSGRTGVEQANNLGAEHEPSRDR
jgi:hypothetical protein